MPVPKIHLSICVFLLCALGLTGAEPLRYPPGFGVVDVTQAPYHADASGATDASAAIQQAIQDHHRRGNRIIYLPPGVYRIDQPVRWQHGSTLGPSLHGAGPAHTVLRVPANTPAFADQDQRHGVLYTGGGMSADRFCIDVADLAIEVGADNPGACGIQYMANNQASLRNLHIRAAPNSGAVGIDMAHSDMVGPALISDVEVEGFAWGIRCAYSVNSQTFERVTLRQQREGGLHNAGQVVTVRRLVSENRVPAVVTAAGTASTVLVDCDFTGGDPGAWAIDNAAALWARDISCSGYRGVLRDAAGEQTRVHEVPFIDEYVSGPSVSIFSGVERSLRLPIQETPQVAWGDVADWINVADFGAIPGDKIDDTAAIQAAFDSGAASVFLPASDTKRGYRIEGSITIPVTLQRLIQGGGQWGGLDLIGAGEHGGLVIDGAGPPLLIERLTAWDVGGADRPLIQHLGSRSVVIAHVNTLLRDCALYVAEPGAGDLFLEDVACHWPMKSTVTWRWPNLRLAPGQRVWARQLNLEKASWKIENRGADLWILGYKTEVDSRILDNAAGARTEILGGLVYPSLRCGQSEAMLVNHEGGILSATIAEAGFHNRFQRLVSDERDGATRELVRGQAPQRCGGSLIPRYAGWIAATDAPAKLPQVEIIARASGIELRWDHPSGCAWIEVCDSDETVLARGASGRITLPAPAPGAQRLGLRCVMTDLRQSAWHWRSVTPPDDHIAPSVVSAQVSAIPPRIEIVFDEAIDPTDAADPTRFECPVAIVAATPDSSSARVVHLELDQPIVSGALQIRGARDRSGNPCLATIALAPEIVTTVAAYQPPTAGHDLPPGLSDNSSWKGGAKATLSIADDQRSAAIGVNKFAQVILGRVPLVAKQRYVLTAQAALQAHPETTLNARLQLRKMHAPYTVYAQGSLSDGASQITFRAPATNPDAVLFLIAKGGGEVRLEDWTLRSLHHQAAPPEPASAK